MRCRELFDNYAEVDWKWYVYVDAVVLFDKGAPAACDEVVRQSMQTWMANKVAGIMVFKNSQNHFDSIKNDQHCVVLAKFVRCNSERYI